MKSSNSLALAGLVMVLWACQKTPPNAVASPQPNSKPQAQGLSNVFHGEVEAAPTIDKVMLGNIIFHDVSLSNPPGQSCASCHKAEFAFADNVAVSEGAEQGAFGNRNAPSLKYASFAPAFNGNWDEDWRGGQFWDGRVDLLEEQAVEPFFNPLEMNTTEGQLAKALRGASYAEHIKALYGEASFNDDSQLVRAAAGALAEFQRSEVFTPFDSKFDYREMGLVEFTESETRGEDFFDGIGMCIDCHVGQVGEKQLFTQFVHHNIAVPPNPELPFYSQPKSVNPAGSAYVDLGLAESDKVPTEHKKHALGLFKTPTLRNIELTAPYMHNGVFKTLDEVVEFYSNMEKFWPAEVPGNRSRLVSSAFEMTEQDKQDLIAFLKTMTDGYPASAELKKQLRDKQEAARLEHEEYLKGLNQSQ